MAMRPGTEQKLLDAAEELFFTRGIAATPVDAVLDRAGVSSATLYRGYPSKEALVAAALGRRHDDWLGTWDAAVATAEDDRGRLLAVFDALDAYRSTPSGSRWCAFLGTAAEYVDAPADVQAVLDQETGTLRRRLTDAAVPLVGSRAGDLGEQLLLVVSGYLAMRLREPGLGTDTARSVASALLDAVTWVSGTAARPARPAGPRR
ncbi:TetR/AcrR family transcriptional regulator [Curtobacterium sp. PhB115]|uniref:TetR/AcrR family transcriptional regulator n=1 Tax=Curtobacterium sp. PhB115 TaxID=2485173 RepID=UPI000F4B911E|nr:TetR/AcrR family transcriptional regulator [Curtobacterium sp. PhB115]ROP61444.1 TetR family transcriptional regulator [Curtobacterium sp. PhB115]